MLIASISKIMSFIRIWVHCVWTTNERIPYLKDDVREKVIFHILDTSRAKNIYIDHINGFTEHLHALISLGSKQNISDVMQSIKGESSFWINKNKLTGLKFEWQDDYYAVSIGISQVDPLRDYIRNQVNHHKKTTWEEEINKLESEYNIIRIKD
jgi:REP element-mobilizing transposase RayT